MPSPKRTPRASADAAETRLLRGGKGVQRLVATSAALMRGREVFHAAAMNGAIPGADVRQLSSLYKITDPAAVFDRCRKLATGSSGFIEWVLFLKKLLFNDGLKIEGVSDPAKVAELERVVDDIWREYLIQNAVPAAWRAAADPDTLPTVQIIDCEGVEYENEFGEETLWIKYAARQVSDVQRKKLGNRIADALATGQKIQWGEIAGEGFAVMTNAKLGQGMGRPRLYSVFEDLALHGLLIKGDWNAAWMSKDVIRQFKKGHEIKQGNLSGMPVHFLKAAERDAIHKAVKDKSGAFDIVTNFDVDVEYPAFDFKFFHEDKYAGVRRRLMEWAGPIGSLYVDDGNNDHETLLTILTAESAAARTDLTRIFRRIVTAEGFESVQQARPGWSKLTLVGLQKKISLVNTMVTNGVMSKITGRALMGLDNETEGANLDKEHADPDKYSSSFQPFQGQGVSKTEIPPTPEGGRPGKK